MKNRKKSLKGAKQKPPVKIEESGEERLETNLYFNEFKSTFCGFARIMIEMFELRRDAVSAKAMEASQRLVDDLFELHRKFEEKKITSRTAYARLKSLVFGLPRIFKPVVDACILDAKVLGVLNHLATMKPTGRKPLPN